MKKTIVALALLSALVFPAVAAAYEGNKTTTTSKDASVEKQLKQMEEDWQKAIKNKNGAALKRIIAEDWVVTDENGKSVNRDAYVSRSVSNTDVIEFSEISDMQVRIYGNTAVVIGGSTEKGLRNGVKYSDSYRWTDVFVNRGGRWQAAVSQWAKY